MTITSSAPIREWFNVDNRTFTEEILPVGRPAVLRGLVSAWPAVKAGCTSALSLAEYIKCHDNRQVVEIIIGAPDIKGRFFYDQNDLRKVNFKRMQSQLSPLLDQLLSMEVSDAHSVATQALPISALLPGFECENIMPLVNVGDAPRIWIGNAAVVQTHLDYYDNIACVIGGKRRFTLFPPEQIGNLYIGPIDNTPAGAPVSMVSPEHPDLDRYPRFADALANAQTTELAPGDALYIPYAWWHHVHSLETFNVLVNYWWNSSPFPANAPFVCLMHGLTALRTLPPRQREVWRAFFNHYIFQEEQNSVTHLKPDQRGMLGEITPEIARQINIYLSKILLQ